MNLKPYCDPIGIFDSGVGGLTVLRAVRCALPHHPLFYMADQAHVPYGARSLEEVREFSEEITRFLINRGAKLIVVACNTASAAALHSLRETFRDIAFIGMEPAIKPAALTSAAGKVGVLATPATFQGKLYASVVERFARGVIIYQDTCPGLVQQVEKGDLDGPLTRLILENALHPMLVKGIDVIVLGCTHYPFVLPLIQKIAGPGVRVIDPAPAVARQTCRMLDKNKFEYQSTANNLLTFFTTAAETTPLVEFLALIKENGHIQTLSWKDGRLW